MSSLTEKLEQGTLPRVLIYGDDKTRKTTWAAEAAEAGFNLLYIDTDDGVHIMNNLSDAAKERVTYLNAKDDFDLPVGAKMLPPLLKGWDYCWDQNSKCVIPISGGKITRPKGHGITYISPKNMTASDVLVVDSYTQLVHSLILQYGQEKNIDVANSKVSWDGYGWAGIILSEFLSAMQSLPCSVIAISHATRFEEKNKVTGDVISSRVYPVSISGPHSTKVGKFFSDVLYTSMIGTSHMITAQPSAQVSCGSRAFKGGVYQFDKLQFKGIADYYNVKTDGQPSKGFIYVNGSASDEEFTAATGLQVREIGGANTATTSASLVSHKPVIKLTK